MHSPELRIAIALDNFNPHRSTKTGTPSGTVRPANSVERAYVPFQGSWLNRIEAQFTGLRYFALNGNDHNSHREQTSGRRLLDAVLGRPGISPSTWAISSGSLDIGETGRRLRD
jgi:hypothetical protein